MDFSTPSPILSGLSKRISEGHFSYPYISKNIYNAIQKWCCDRYSWDIDKNWIVIIPNAMSGMRIGVDCASSQSPIFIQKPNYPKILELGSTRALDTVQIETQKTNRPISSTDLCSIHAANPGSLVLCNPLNPTGIVTKRQDLEDIANTIKDLDTIVVSDEIHADFVFSPAHHTPAGSVSGLENKSITIMSPTKTFNLSGIPIAYAIIPSKALREKFIHIKKKYYSGINALGLVALEHGYLHCSEWLDELLVELLKNRDFLKKALSSTILNYNPSDALYLAWIDTGTPNSTIYDKLFSKKILVSDGNDFGLPGWIRFNFACPMENLLHSTNMISRILGAIK